MPQERKKKRKERKKERFSFHRNFEYCMTQGDVKGAGRFLEYQTNAHAYHSHTRQDKPVSECRIDLHADAPPHERHGGAAASPKWSTDLTSVPPPEYFIRSRYRAWKCNATAKVKRSGRCTRDTRSSARSRINGGNKLSSLEQAVLPATLERSRNTNIFETFVITTISIAVSSSSSSSSYPHLYLYRRDFSFSVA